MGASNMYHPGLDSAMRSWAHEQARSTSRHSASFVVSSNSLYLFPLATDRGAFDPIPNVHRPKYGLVLVTQP
jgi:hypothetical protein